MKKQRFKIRLLPIILFTAFVILIVRAHAYSLDFGSNPDISIGDTTQLWDLFSYAKSSAILIITVYAALTMCYLLLVGRLKIKRTIIYIPMVIYLALTIISYVMSDYKWIAWGGAANRFEGTRTIICYMFMLFYAINVIDELGDALVIVKGTMASVFFACIVGITQFLKHDILLTGIVNKMLTGASDLPFSAEFEPGQVYQTVGNMNYVGMYLSLVVPILVYTIYYFCLRKNRYKLLSQGIDNGKCKVVIRVAGLLLLLIALNVLGAGSMGGVLGIATSLVILLIVLLEKKWQKVLSLLVFGIAFICLLTYVYVVGIDDHNNTGHRQIDYFETGIDRVNMSVDGEPISIIYDRKNDSYSLKDDENRSVSIFWYADEEGIYQIDDPRYEGKFRLIPLKDINGEACVNIDIMEKERESFGFTFYEDGARYLNPFGNEVSLNKVKSLGFKGHLSAGSGRGYIWSRTLPLLKERILIGSGAGTFMLVFPQNDYAGKYSSGTPLNITYDKPHNMYLNMAVGTGVLSMIAFLAMVGMIMWKAFHQGEDKKLIKVMAAGIVGFLVAGIFNDSTVSIMPMFYGLLGTVAGLCI